MDPRLHIIAALREAGLVEEADRISDEVARERTGVSVERRAKVQRPRSSVQRPTVQDRLTVLLAEAGVCDLRSWNTSKGYWLRAQVDVMRWECRARWWGERENRWPGFHVGSWSSMTDCVRYGIIVVDGERAGGYCTISVEPKRPIAKSRT